VAQAAAAVKVSPKAFRHYACKTLKLGRYWRRPGDGRRRPDIAASILLWAQILGYLLRETSFLAMEQLSKCGRGRVLGVARKFGDDALGYFTERLAPEPTRRALAGLLEQAKRNKAFDGCCFIGLALDGTGVCRSAKAGCQWCRPYYNDKDEIAGHHHALAAIAVVGGGLTLPFDAEPYGPGDCEYNAGQRLLRRAAGHLGKRFADYVVVDGEFATAPFLHAANDAGLHAVARLKDNLPELLAQARRRFEHAPPQYTFRDGADYVELWDADDFDPWDTLRWPSVRVFRYRQHKPDGTVVDAYWLTDYPTRLVGPQTLYRFAKNRWEVENQVFNDAKNRYGFEHIPHHHANSLLIHWLLVFLTLCIERLYRLRYLHRGNHPPLTPIQLLRRLRLSIAAPAVVDTG
jgi:hypothetical protein